MSNPYLKLPSYNVNSKIGLGNSGQLGEAVSKGVNWNQMTSSFSQIWEGFLKIWPFLLLTVIILYVIYFTVSYFFEMRRRYNCYSFTNLFNGNFFKCSEPKPEFCKDINPNLYWGWCADQDYYGAYAGDSIGPFGISCNRWISNPHRCPPLKCEGNYPIGIKVNEKKGHIQEYGWCADPEINRALKGTYCGPDPNEGVKCRNWIWREENCPKTCPVSGMGPDEKKYVVAEEAETECNLPPVPQEAIVDKSDCSLICGVKDGKQVPCPPPDCKGGKCQCATPTKK